MRRKWTSIKAEATALRSSLEAKQADFIMGLEHEAVIWMLIRRQLKHLLSVQLEETFN